MSLPFPLSFFGFSFLFFFLSHRHQYRALYSSSFEMWGNNCFHSTGTPDLYTLSWTNLPQGFQGCVGLIVELMEEIDIHPQIATLWLLRHWQHPHSPNLICSPGHCHSASHSLFIFTIDHLPLVLKFLSYSVFLPGLNFLRSSRSLSGPYPFPIAIAFGLSCGQHCSQVGAGLPTQRCAVFLHDRCLCCSACGNLDLRAGAALHRLKHCFLDRPFW